MSEVLALGAESQQVVASAPNTGSLAGAIGNWTGKGLESIGKTMQKHPILSTVAVVGVAWAVSRYIDSRDQAIQESRDAVNTLQGFQLAISALKDKEVNYGKSTISGGSSGGDPGQGEGSPNPGS